MSSIINIIVYLAVCAGSFWNSRQSRLSASMIFPRSISYLSVLFLSFVSLVAARPGLVDDSSFIFRRNNQCPSASGPAYTKCFELKYEAIHAKCNGWQTWALLTLAPSSKLKHWICYNQQTGTIYIEGKSVQLDWLAKIVAGLGGSASSSCTVSKPWAPCSWGSSGSGQCTPPPQQCVPGYTNCNGCCQSRWQACSTHRARSILSRRDSQICQVGQSKCYLGSGLFDCIDTNADVESCGGCLFQQPDAERHADFKAGQDCTEIPNISAVQCNQGRCIVEKCAPSYKLDRPTNTCVPLKMGSLKIQKYRLPDSS